MTTISALCHHDDNITMTTVATTTVATTMAADPQLRAVWFARDLMKLWRTSLYLLANANRPALAVARKPPPL